MFDGERNFRNQDDVCPAGESGFERDPSAIAAHHFYHHHAMVRGRSGVNFIDGVGDGMQRGIESKRDLGRRQIVVDRLGHADNLHALLRKFVADLLRSIAANA